MAKAVKSKGAKSALKTKKKVVKSNKKVVSTAAQRKTTEKVVKAKSKKGIPAQGAAKASALVAPPAKTDKKELSQKLVDTIEKRITRNVLPSAARSRARSPH